MLNFDFHNPTRIVFGRNRIADLAKLVPAEVRVLLLVGGASAEKTGTLAEVRQALGARNINKLGEHVDVTLAISRRVLEASL